MSYQAQLTDRSSVEKSLSLTLDPGAFDARFQKELLSLIPKVQLKGFRPGRAPKAMVEKMYGDRIHSDVLMEMVNHALTETVKENKLEVIGTSEFKVDDTEPGSPIGVSLVLSLYPEPELKELSGLEVELPVKKVSEELISRRLEGLQDMFAEVVDVEDRTVAQDGDLITFSYTGVFVNEDGTESPDLTGNLAGDNAKAELGKKEIPENLEAAIIGMAVDEMKVIPHVFGEESNAEVKGKNVLFSISLEKIQAKKRPQLDDDFAKKTGVAANMAELSEYLKKEMERAFAKENRDVKTSVLLDAVIKRNDFEVPQVMADEEIRFMLAEMRVLDPSKDDFYKTPVDGFREMFKEQAARRVKHGIVMRKLIKDLDIKVGEKELAHIAESIAEESGSTTEEIMTEYADKEGQQSLERLATIRLLTDRLSKDAVITEKLVDANELLKQ